MIKSIFFSWIFTNFPPQFPGRAVRGELAVRVGVELQREPHGPLVLAQLGVQVHSLLHLE